MLIFIADIFYCLSPYINLHVLPIVRHIIPSTGCENLFKLKDTLSLVQFRLIYSHADLYL